MIFLFFRHDFYPSGGRGTIEDSEDEIEVNFELLENDLDDENILFHFRERAEFIMENDSSDTSDDEDIAFLPAEGFQNNVEVNTENNAESDSDSIIEDTENEEVDKPVAEKATPNDCAACSSSTSNTSVPKRVIDDYDENEEEDDVIKKIISEIKKPRSKPPDITTEDYVVDLSFHPEQNILAVGNVTGDIIIYKYTNEENSILYTHEVHTKAIRDIEFSTDGKSLFSASRDKSIMITDFETGKLKRFWDNAHEEPVYKLSVIDENLFATGDDDGTLKLWDLRQNGTSAVFSVKVVEDFISGIVTNSQKKLLCCTSGDGFLSTIHMGSK